MQCAFLATSLLFLFLEGCYQSAWTFIKLQTKLWRKALTLWNCESTRSFTSIGSLGRKSADCIILGLDLRPKDLLLAFTSWLFKHSITVCIDTALLSIHRRCCQQWDCKVCYSRILKQNSQRFIMNGEKTDDHLNCWVWVRIESLPTNANENFVKIIYTFVFQRPCVKSDNVIYCLSKWRVVGQVTIMIDIS